jgi:hypothetical protein
MFQCFIKKVKLENKDIQVGGSAKTKTITITTLSSAHHIELNPRLILFINPNSVVIQVFMIGM